jgi:hypothetical protein
MFRSRVTSTLFSLRAAAFTAMIALSAPNAAQAVTVHPHPGPAIRTAKDIYGAKYPQAKAAFTTLDNPGDPTFNQLLSIDDKGTIAGYFGSGMQGHPNIAYIIKPPYTKYIPAMVPASTQTQVQSFIEGGTNSGFWAPSNTGTDANFGFIELVNGSTLYLDVNDPLTGSLPVVNQVVGVNAAGNAAGFYNDVNGLSHGYVFSIKTGGFTPVNVSGATSTQALGINANNIVCGSYTKPKSANVSETKGFLLNLATNASTHFAITGSLNTQFLGINKNGIAVGFYTGSDNFPHGFIYNSATGAVIIVNDPNAAQGTTLNGINDNGEIVGFYGDAAGNTHGMIVTGAY